VGVLGLVALLDENDELCSVGKVLRTVWLNGGAAEYRTHNEELGLLTGC